MLVRPPPRLTNKNALNKYIESDLWTWLKEVATSFLRINFQDNFQAFIVSDISIPAGNEVAISNEFRNRYPGSIPIGRIIIRQTGDATIVDGDSPWTSDLVFLKNPSQNNVVVSVLFFN